MAVKVATAGAGMLLWPGTPNVKPALSNNEGFWTGFWIKVTGTSGGSALYGVAGFDSSDDGLYTSSNEQGVYTTRTDTTKKFDLRLKSGATDVWSGTNGAGLTNAFSGMTAFALGGIYLVVYGVIDVSGSGDWRMFRAVVEKTTGTVLGNEISAAVGSLVTTFATSTHRWLDSLFQSNGATQLTAPDTALEHVVCVRGKFPIAAGVPDAAILAGLGNGTYKWDDSAVLNGGTILDWRKLKDATDLGNSGSNGVGALTMSGTVSDGGLIAPSNWSTNPILTEKPAGFVLYGQGAGIHSWSGVYSGTAPGALKARIRDVGTGLAVSGFDWQQVVASPSGNAFTFSFSNVPVGGPYLIDVRWGDDTATQTLGGNEFYSGAVVVMWGQSQCARLRSLGGSGGLVTPTAGIKASVFTCSNITDTSTASVGCTRITGVDQTGSGYAALLNQWWADTSTPIMLVDNAYSGTGIEYWVSDRKGDYPTNADVTTLWGDGADPDTGLSTFLAYHIGFKADAIFHMQGTNDVTSGAGTYAAYMDTLKGMFGALYTNLPLYAVLPHQRSCDSSPNGNPTWIMRNVQYQKAISGGRYRVCCFLNDWQMDSDGGPHQVSGATGNIRAGTRIGRGLAGVLYDTGLDRLGPQVTSIAFTDANKTAFDITFDRDIETADGSTTALPQFYVTTDAWASTTGWPRYNTGFSAAIVWARVVRITKDSGDWLGATVQVDYQRSEPYFSNGTTIVESTITTELNKFLYGTTAFDGGRGVPAAPFMGNGLTVPYSADSGASAQSRSSRMSMRMGL